MVNQEVNLNNKHIAIVTHKSLMPCIPGDDLMRFVLDRGCSNLTYITHPLLLLKESYKFSSKVSYYKGSRAAKTTVAYHWVLPEPLLYVKDLIYTLVWIFATDQTYDIYFGMNNLNAFAGLVLKKLGRVKKVVYYTIDLYPQRFSSEIINWIYHKLDNVCVRFCDETWNVSQFLVQWRKERGMIGSNYSRQFTVPIGIWFDEMKRVSISKVKKTSIVFIGHLIDFRGVDLAIRALPLIRGKNPNIKLEIIGIGEELENLKRLANEIAVSSHVNFYGWLDQKEANFIVSKGSIGLATYNTLITDEKIKNADPGKIKYYLGLGLPLVMTNASLNAREIERAKCGIIVEYTPKALAHAVIKLLSNEKLLKEYRKNALLYVKQFDWNHLFTKNISRLL